MRSRPAERRWPFLGAVAALSALSGASCRERELPPDPVGMTRAIGTKLSIPLPAGYAPLTEGSEKVVETAREGGVSIIKAADKPDETVSIVVEVGRVETPSWTDAGCETLARDTAELLASEVQHHERVTLPTGEACHFVTRAADGVVNELYHLAGRPPRIVACRSHGTAQPQDAAKADCEHVARWVRLTKGAGP